MTTAKQSDCIDALKCSIRIAHVSGHIRVEGDFSVTGVCVGERLVPLPTAFNVLLSTMVQLKACTQKNICVVVFHYRDKTEFEFVCSCVCVRVFILNTHRQKAAIFLSFFIFFCRG